MAQNFKISIHRKIDNLYIHLMGDFDGSSAFELLNTLWENLNSAKFILIDTYSLKEVYPFGLEVFYNNFLRIKNQRIRIQFLGANALQLDRLDSFSLKARQPWQDSPIKSLIGVKDEHQCRKKSL